MNRFVAFLFASMALVWCGCHSAGQAGKSVQSGAAVTRSAATTTVFTNAPPAELARPNLSLFTLGPGDRVDIEVLGHPESRASTFIAPDGKIYYYLLSGQPVWGLTLNQARELLERELGKLMTDPQVTLQLREVGSKHVWLLGRLSKPGLYPITGPISLLEALSLAGGTARSTSEVKTEELADLRHSFVMRRGELLPVDFQKLLRDGDMSQNIYLQPDDFVFVPSALSQQVYVLGSVLYPRTVPYNDRMTLMTALSGASGPLKLEWFATTNPVLAPDADVSHVAVVRGSLTTPELTVVDANSIMKGKAADFPLEPGDIVFVPNTPYGTAKRYFNIIVNTFITTVAANAGIQAGGGSAVTVSYPVGR
jgi:polysaccharide export outer membrane protein